MEDRKRAMKRALWSFFAGDALAAPSHWFYGGIVQIKNYYGRNGIIGYTKPVRQLGGSIMNKSDVNGGGRSKDLGKKQFTKSIIGDVINHGKADLWSPQQQIHYHATLQAGENTLEVQLARVLMKSMVQTDGKFDPNHFREAYMEFMQRPGSNNDAYASTCHRMFFANLVHNNLPPEKCPDNDGHNVDTIDGLILPTIVSLAEAVRPTYKSNKERLAGAAKQAVACASVTRNSMVLGDACAAWSELIVNVMGKSTPSSSSSIVQKAAETVAKKLGMRKPKVRSADEVTACYLGSSMPALLDNIVKYNSNRGSDIWMTLLANANTGGENVARGSVLGAALGAAAASPNDPLPEQLFHGLYDHESLEKEIEEFVNAVTKE
jgi:ADP-ribosylglycohydrolase